MNKILKYYRKYRNYLIFSVKPFWFNHTLISSAVTIKWITTLRLLWHVKECKPTNCSLPSQGSWRSLTSLRKWRKFDPSGFIPTQVRERCRGRISALTYWVNVNRLSTCRLLRHVHLLILFCGITAPSPPTPHLIKWTLVCVIDGNNNGVCARARSYVLCRAH